MATNQSSKLPRGKPSPPSIDEIEAMLRGFRPEPGEQFYRRMQNAPWMTRQPARRGWLGLSKGLRVAAYGLIACLVLVGALLTVPSLRVVGSQLFRFFSPAESDRQNIQVIVPTPGLSPEYSLTLDQAQETAGFPIRQPAYLPAGLRFEGARYNSLIHSVGLRYTSPTGSLIFNQRPTRAANESSSISPNAPVVTIQVGDSYGEYVSGGWILASEPEQPIEKVTPGTPVNLRLYWDPELPQQILRWEMGDMSYEIICSSGGSLTQKDLIRIAESVR